MASQGSVHLISKQHNDLHAVVQLPQDASTTPLPAGTIRVRTAIVGLTSNNLTYARMGTMLHWWDTFPLPSNLPAPYDSSQDYGIVPAWGFGEILESGIANLQPGQLLWGFWPTSSVPFQLSLSPGDVDGFWNETSAHRQQLMRLYNEYRTYPTPTPLKSISQQQLDDLAWQATVGALSPAGVMLSTFVLGAPAMHPMGAADWTEADADVSEAVIIALSAGGKTARCFVDAFVHERGGSPQPLGLLAVTGGADVLPKTSFPSRTVGYADVAGDETVGWIAGLRPRRIVVADFGGRGSALQDLLAASAERVPEAKVTVIGIGAEPKIFSEAEMSEMMRRSAQITNRVQMNTSPLKDAVVAKVGGEKLHAHLDAVWNGFVERGGLKRLRLVWGKGIEGERGLEGGWKKLCNQNVASDECLAFRV